MYPRPVVFRATPGIRLSSYEKILRELDSGFSSAEEIEAADQLLDDLFLKTERALITHQPVDKWRKKTKAGRALLDVYGDFGL